MKRVRPRNPDMPPSCTCPVKNSVIPSHVLISRAEVDPYVSGPWRAVFATLRCLTYSQRKLAKLASNPRPRPLRHSEIATSAPRSLLTSNPRTSHPPGASSQVTGIPHRDCKLIYWLKMPWGFDLLQENKDVYDIYSWIIDGYYKN